MLKTEKPFVVRLDAAPEQAFLDALAAENARTARYGLALTEREQRILQKKRADVLLETGRVEFGESAVSRIIEAFCDSPYLLQDEYAAVLCDLIDAFYALKNVCGNLLTDDELLSAMREAYDDAGGTIDAVLDLSTDVLCGYRTLDEELSDDD